MINSLSVTGGVIHIETTAPALTLAVESFLEATNGGSGDSVTEALRALEERVRERSGGRLRILSDALGADGVRRVFVRID